MKYLIVILFLVGCSNADQNVANLYDSAHKLEYIGSTYNTCEKCEATVTLKFKDIDTGEKSQKEYGVSTALKKLGWLNKKNCYTLPLDDNQHKQVSCG